MGAILFLLLCGCTSTPEPDTRVYTDRELRAQIEADNRNPWPHYALAKKHLARGEYEDAVRRYGRAINLLPPNKATRPVLELGILHHRMGNTEPALRCYEEVLATVPYEASEVYARNSDFKYAVVGIKVLLEKQEDAESRIRIRTRIEELRDRFLREFNGTQDQWDRGAVWITPLETPAAAGEE